MSDARRARAELREPLDRQPSPLGLTAMGALAPRPGEAGVRLGAAT